MFVSTRDGNNKVDFKDAVFQGLCSDGGLFHFENMPNLTALIHNFKETDSFIDIASNISLSLFPDLFSETESRFVCEQAFRFGPKLVEIDENIFCLELFHGPTCAFKDFGAAYLAACMEVFLKNDNKKAVILTATSGDTGSAVANAFYLKNNIDVVILYPQNRVSRLQEKQLTTLGGNIHALEVKGSFDDCQRIVKEAFTNIDLKRAYNLTSANSINLGRLIPQSFYYIWAYTQLKEKNEKISFCVPSGNFGNLTAGLYAYFWGMPTEFFIAATNINDVVPEYLKTGSFFPRDSKKTLSNAMDVGNPSNFERMLALYNNDSKKMSSEILYGVVTDDETLLTMKSYYKATKKFLDPHTAVGYKSAKEYFKARRDYDGLIVLLSTAHPGKFIETVREATGITIPVPEAIKKYENKEKISTIVNNSVDDLINYLDEKFRTK